MLDCDRLEKKNLAGFSLCIQKAKEGKPADEVLGGRSGE